MGLFGKKKKDVPEELPDLISDEIEKSTQEVHEYLKKNEEEVQKKEEPKKEEKKEVEVVKEEKPHFVEPIVAEERSANPRPIPKHSKEIVTRLIKNVNDENEKQKEEREIGSTVSLPNQSFFDELQNALTGQLDKVDKLEEVLDSKFLSRDILSDMREYWEKKKEDSVLEILGKTFQAKINEKIEKLQDLERIWQGIYFELLEKEEEIREQEEELKETLKEFMEVYKKKKKNLSKEAQDSNNEKESSKEKDGEEEDKSEEKVKQD